MIHREQADPGFVAWRKVFMKERVNMWQQSHGEQMEPVRAALTGNRLWHCLGRSVEEGNEVICSVRADRRNSWEFTSGQTRHCSTATSFSSCKHGDAIGQYQLPPAGHRRLLFQLLPVLLQRDHEQMTEHARSSLSLAFLCCSSVPVSCTS